jgi:2-oxoglutarate ferredoxin oxidoreductase subunit gamma
MIPALELAQEVGNSRLANMVMLGVLAQLSGVITVKQVIKALPEALDPRYHKMIPINTQALQRGAAFAAQEL